MLNKTYFLALMLASSSMAQSITCFDTAGYNRDQWNDGCEWYNNRANRYPNSSYDDIGCGLYDTNDFKAYDMCCGCGGGYRTKKNEDCNFENTYEYIHDNGIRLMAILRGWFDGQPVNECIDDDFLVRYIEVYFSLALFCDELQTVMVESMEQTPGLNWNEFIEHIRIERPWMTARVKQALSKPWQTCFTEFGYTMSDSVGIDYIRNMLPFYLRPDPDLVEILNISHLLEETLTNWFLGYFDRLNPAVDNDFIVDAFEATKQNCGVLDNVMDNVVEATSDKRFDQLYNYLNVPRFDFLRFYITHAWQICHPDHFDTRKAPETEMNVDWLTYLLANNDLFSEG